MESLCVTGAIYMTWLIVKFLILRLHCSSAVWHGTARPQFGTAWPALTLHHARLGYNTAACKYVPPESQTATRIWCVFSTVRHAIFVYTVEECRVEPRRAALAHLTKVGQASTAWYTLALVYTCKFIRTVSCRAGPLCGASVNAV